MNLQLETPAPRSTVTDAGEIVLPAVSPLELRTDHSIGRALLLRSAADLLAERASFSWCSATAEPASGQRRMPVTLTARPPLPPLDSTCSEEVAEERRRQGYVR